MSFFCTRPQFQQTQIFTETFWIATGHSTSVCDFEKICSAYDQSLCLQCARINDVKFGDKNESDHNLAAVPWHALHT